MVNILKIDYLWFYKFMGSESEKRKNINENLDQYALETGIGGKTSPEKNEYQYKLRMKKRKEYNRVTYGSFRNYRKFSTVKLLFGTLYS